MLKAILKKVLSDDERQSLLKLQRKVLLYKEYVVGGGKLRELLLLKLLKQHYASKFRRQWILSEEQPHFTESPHWHF